MVVDLFNFKKLKFDRDILIEVEEKLIQLLGNQTSYRKVPVYTSLN